MKKMKLYISILILLFIPICSNAQQEQNNRIIADQVMVEKIGDSIRMIVNLNLDNLDIPSQQMITVTPIARSADRQHFYEFDPIILTGRTRDKALKRGIGFGHIEFEKKPQLIERRYNNKPQSLPLVLQLPYAEWLHEADLLLVEDLTGCACELKDNREYSLTGILPPLFVPRYQLSYVVPPAEEVKRRSETYTARINFELNKYKILYNYKNNAQILDEVDIIVKELQNDKNLTITEFSITGYASPEGVPQSNMELSKNRAHAFVTYLRNTYNINSGMVKTDWKGEDWDGLRKVVSESHIVNKNEILNVLDIQDVMTRKAELKKLSGGETYRMLLKDYYPPLRRNEYTVSYIAKPFSVEEAKVIIKKNPRHLSENEIFLVANTYPKDSREFKEVFDIAGKVYPDNPYTQLNIIALDVERNNWNTASVQKLQKMNTPEAWNNLGVIYTQQGDYDKADALFAKAANAGSKEARHNKEQLAKYRKNTLISETILQQ